MRKFGPGPTHTDKPMQTRPMNRPSFPPSRATHVALAPWLLGATLLACTKPMSPRDPLPG